MPLDLSANWRFHEATKHSLASVRSNRHRLDWDNQPRPYKRYVRPRQIPLPDEVLPSGEPALAAIAGSRPVSGDAPLGLPLLATLLHLSAGITKWLTFPGYRMAFRAAACTGALYHIDLYVVCEDLPGLEAGVYHFDVESGALTVLRSGDYRRAVIEASAGDEAAATAPVVLIATSTFWRNSWKYQSRTWRHCFWDSGTILANLLAVANAHHLPARVVAAFVDAQVNALLDLDTNREVALALVPLGAGGTSAPVAPPITPLGLATEPYSAFEVDYPLIREAHAASSLADADEVSAWRASLPERYSDGTGSAPTGEGTIEEVIQRRGSARQFWPAPIALASAEAMLAAAEAPIAADFPTLARPYAIVNAVDGLEPGAYRGLRDVVRLGSSRLLAGHLALDQRLAADAALNVYFLAQPSAGERGYRAAQLDGSIRGGRVYLAAYAQGLAASGLTFFDDEVSELFETSEQVIFLVAAGVRRPNR